MKTSKRNFFLHILIFVLFTGLLFSQFALSLSATGGNRPLGEEIPGRQTSYEQYAAFIAGIRTPQSALAPLEKSAAWTKFASFFDQHWEQYDRKQLAPMREWAQRELAGPISSGLTVLYPFSGPDFVNSYTLFPSAKNYIFLALQPVGTIPDFQTLSEKDFDAFFADLQHLLYDPLRKDYFISAHMHEAMENKDLNGVLPVILFFMAREKARILDVEYWFIGADGAIQKNPALGKSRPEPGDSIPGVRILFESAGSPLSAPQTLYYFRLNLHDTTFRHNTRFIPFLKSFGPFITFMKSASYVMFGPQVSTARQFVLDQSRYVLQEDSGIPFRYFDPSAWTLKLYGAYSEPISIFKHVHQADLAMIYEKGRDIRPLPFGIGYHFQAGRANLLFATRK